MHKFPHDHPLIKVLSFLTYFPTDALSFGDGLGAEGVSCRAGARVGAGGRSLGSVGAVFSWVNLSSLPVTISFLLPEEIHILQYRPGAVVPSRLVAFLLSLLVHVRHLILLTLFDDDDGGDVVRSFLRELNEQGVQFCFGFQLGSIRIGK